jgi:hypothetical protein
VSDEYQLVLRSKDREYSAQHPRRSSRIESLATTDEYKVALKAHEERLRELAQVKAVLNKDIDEWEKESVSWAETDTRLKYGGASVE